MGLFSGLEKFGLGKLEKMDVFEEEKKRDAVEHPKKDQATDSRRRFIV